MPVWGLSQKLGGGLVAGAQGDEEVAGDIALGDAENGGQGAVHLDAQVGGLGHLLHVDIDHAGDGAELLADGRGDGEILGVIDGRAGDLDIDRSGEAEVEDLGDDVGRGEEEAEFGELPGKFPAEGAHVVGGGLVVLGEGDEDFAIRGRHDRAIGERQVDAAVGDAHIVQQGLQFGRGNGPADGVFNLGEIVFGLLDAGARGAADVQAELAGVNGGEEVGADLGEEAAGNRRPGAGMPMLTRKRWSRDQSSSPP